MIENTKDREKFILVAVQTHQSDEELAASLDELADLLDTAGGDAVVYVTQVRESAHPGTYVGKGKLEELKQLLDAYEADGIVCDDELSPAQMKNLENELGCKVMDRTIVILDIFAGRARTSEGKIQVELAQLKYNKTRLAGHGLALSRQGGGIGTRGPGESKIETDRRRIREREGILNAQLKEVIRHRDTTRKQRERNHETVAAIVGYTNAGKSTLLNRLTDADVLSEDQLFATLDPTTRALNLENGQKVLLTDTVGFIRKLPHHLIDAFRSTLEEARYADIIVHVVDASNPDYRQHMQVVYDTLRSLGAEGKPVITLFNKADKLEEVKAHIDPAADRVINVSARTGLGLEEFAGALEEILRKDKIYLDKVFAFSEAGQIQKIRASGELISEEYTAEGIHVTAYVDSQLAGKLQ